MRTVGETVDVVRTWVEEDGCQIPGFGGAYLYGGITQMPVDAPFPDFRDVDLIVVSTDGTRPSEENLELDLHHPRSRVARHAAAQRLAGQVFQVTERILVDNPRIAG